MKPLRWVAAQWTELTSHENWNVGWVDAPIHRFLDPGFTPVVRWSPPAGRHLYRADPFATSAQPEIVLCEEYDHATGLGYLVALCNGKAVQKLRGFPPGLHASYPYLVNAGDSTFCLPEIYQSGTATLYGSAAFPLEWTSAAVALPHFAAVDPTLFEHDGRWWLAATNGDTDPNGELWLWHASSIRGPWTPHARNPVKCDVASARPAGTPFQHRGVLYRPAQDCSRTYGGAVVIHRVEHLTPDAFHEIPVRVVSPRPEWPWPHGLHTLTAVGERTLLDAKCLVTDSAAFRRILRRKLRLLAGGAR